MPTPPVPPLVPGPGSILLRESWRGRIVNVLLLSGLMAALVTRNDGGARTVLIVLWVLLLVGEAYRSVRPVATLSPDKIVIHNARPRELAWSQITEVTTVRRFGGKRIMLVTADGDQWVMEGPSRSLFARPTFDASLATLREWWTRHRGAQPPPEAPRPDAGETSESETPKSL